MGVSQLLGGTSPGCPPQSTPMQLVFSLPLGWSPGVVPWIISLSRHLMHLIH